MQEVVIVVFKPAITALRIIQIRFNQFPGAYIIYKAQKTVANSV
jgi:hypothetical protein